MKPRRRFSIALLAVCLAVLASLPDLACSPRKVPDSLPVEESLPAASYERPLMPPAPPDQTSTIRFERISLEEGLSQSSVFAILQDQRGFMWFGTEDGLNKYDGYAFTVYKHDADDPMALSNSYVRAIYEDRSGELWVGTRSGLDRFDRTTGTFTHYQHNPNDPQSLGGTRVYSIYEDHTGTLWVGTADGGLDQLDRATNTFTHYQHDLDDPKALSDNTVWTIYEDRGGELWIGTGGGLDRFDRTTGTFTHYQHDPSDPQSLIENKVRAIYEDHQGALWIGTEGGGLDQLDRSTQTFTHYRHNPDDPHSLSDNRVWAILQDRAGRLWVGTQNGLDLLDRRQNRFVHYRHDPNDPHSLSCDSVRSIYEDRSGVLWIGTLGGGLSKYNRTADNFTLYQHRPNLPNSLSDNIVWSIYEDRSGLLWIGTFGGGLNKLDRDSGTFTAYQHDPADPTSLSGNDVRAIYEDHLGILWVGTNYGGLSRFDPQTETFTHYRHDPHDPGSLSDNDAFVIYEDRSGNLWIGTWNGGLNCLDRSTETFTHYQHDAGDPFSLSDNCVRAIYEDWAGMLWVGTRGGGNLWDGANGRFTHYRHDPDDPQSLSNGAVLSFYEDPAGAVWIATYGGGLNRFDRATQTFTHYTEKDGLPNDGVYGILADAEGFLWISTNKGLSKFDPRTETFRNYDVRDGLQSNEFNAGAYFQSSSGEMFFGGIQGFNAFYPERVKPNPHVPPIVITAFSRFNEVVRTDLSPNEHIQLSYKDDFISFEFAALDYTAPEKNQYAYMLEGQDKDWVSAGTRRHADYTNLRGGDYVLRVKGSNNDGVWNEEGVAAYLTVTPAIWETWWFRGIVLLVLVGGVIGGYRLRVRSVEARSRKLETQVRERTCEIERRTQELSALNAIAAVVSRSLDLQEILNDALEKTLEVMEIEAGGIYLLQEDAEVLTIAIHRGLSAQFVAEIDSLAVGEGFSGRVVQTGEPLVVRDLSTDPRLTRLAVKEAGFHSVAISPLVSSGKVLGSLFVMTHGHREFSQQDIELLTSIGGQIGVAVENAQLFGQADQRMRELEALYRADEEMLRHLKLDRVLQALVDVAVGILQADKGSLMVWDAERDRLVVRAARGFSPETMARMSFALGEGVVGRVAASDEPIVVEDVSTDPRVAERITEPEGIRSFMHVPIKVGGQVFGVFNLSYAQPRAFGDDEQRLFIALAQRAALAIENAQLYEQAQELAVVRERQRLARDLHDAVTQTLFSASLIAEVLPRIWERNPDEGRRRLEEVRQLTRGALAEMRTLLLELRPAALAEAGLGDLLRQLAEAVTGRARVPVAVEVRGEYSHMTPDVKVALYRIAQEALNNVAKHAGASQARVSLCCGPGRVELRVSDDGRGFDVDSIPPDHLGVGIMRERAEAIGAALTIGSEVGRGTEVVVVYGVDEG